MRPARFFVIAGIVVFGGCSQQNIASSTAELGTLNQQYLTAKADWVQADTESVLTLCPVATATNRSEYTTALKKWNRVANVNPTDENNQQRDRAQQRLTDLDDRVRACNSISDTGAPVRAALALAASDPTGAKWDQAQRDATKAVSASIDLVNRLPSSSIRGMSYSDETQQNLREKRSKILAGIGEMMPHAVDAAKAASGAVLSQTASATHELDKQFAEGSDRAYSNAATGLAALPNVAGPQAFFAGADSVIAQSGYAVRLAAHQAGSGVLSMDERVGTIATASFAPMATPGRLPSAKEQAASVTGSLNTPVEAVRLYYQMWDRKEYRTMYGLLSNNFRATHAYDSWRGSHTSTTSISVSASQGASPSDVNAEISASDGDYSGTWHLVEESGAWRLDSYDPK